MVGGEEAGGEVEAAAGEVSHGGLAEGGLEAGGEDGAGEAAFAGEGGEGPVFGGAAVEQGEGGGDGGIADAGEQAGEVFGGLAGVAADGFEEEGLGEAGEDGAGAGAGGSGLGDGEADGVFEPVAGGILAETHFEHGGQAGEDGGAEAGVEGHEAADDAGGFAAATEMGEFEAAGEDMSERIAGFHGADIRAIAEDVGVAVGEGDDVAGGEWDVRAAALQPGVHGAGGEHVEDDEVAGGGGEVGGVVAGRGEWTVQGAVNSAWRKKAESSLRSARTSERRSGCGRADMGVHPEICLQDGRDRDGLQTKPDGMVKDFGAMWLIVESKEMQR